MEGNINKSEFILYFENRIPWLYSVGLSGKEKVVTVILIQFMIVGQIGSADALFPLTVRSNRRRSALVLREI